MSDIENARELLAAAQRDARALKGMLDVNTFADEIFGFHAQQAVEKALKAWIAATGHDYPLTHNLIVLLSQLEDQGLSVGRFWHLVQFNAFAVQFRYGQSESLGSALDRSATIQEVDELVDYVAGVVAGLS